MLQQHHRSGKSRRRVFPCSSMCSILLLLLFISGALSQSLGPVLEARQRQHVLDVIKQALEKEDPVVRQALIASIGFSHIPYQDPGLSGKSRVIIVIGTILLLMNLFCLYVMFLWIVYVFQKRGIRERYHRWSAARDLRLEQEEFLFRQRSDKKLGFKQEIEEKFNKAE
ncbi:hypothetical protein PMIN07_010630 [Paraphaeosphaeria minitans]